MAPKKNEIVGIPVINNVEDTKKTFLKDLFIPGKWVDFHSLREEGFDVKDLFDHVGWTSILENFSSWHYGPYALFRELPDKTGWALEAPSRGGDFFCHHYLCLRVCSGGSDCWQGLEKGDNPRDGGQVVVWKKHIQKVMIRNCWLTSWEQQIWHTSAYSFKVFCSTWWW